MVGAGEVGVHEGDCGVGVAGGGQEGEGGRDCGEDRVSWICGGKGGDGGEGVLRPKTPAPMMRMESNEGGVWVVGGGVAMAADDGGSKWTMGGEMKGRGTGV